VSELHDLVQAALGAATDGEQVEAYAEEERRTEVSALRGEVEGMTFAESRGVGVRVIRDERLGYAWAADPTEDEVRAAVSAARENAALAEPDPSNVLPDATAVGPMPELYRAESAAIPADDKVRTALDLERSMNVLAAARIHLDFPPTFRWFLDEYRARTPLREQSAVAELPPAQAPPEELLEHVRQLRAQLRSHASGQ